MEHYMTPMAEAVEFVIPKTIIVTEKIGVGEGSIAAPEFTQTQAEEEAREVSGFRRAVDWHNPAVCIDGRCCAPGDQKLPLGAHIAGGAETLLVAAKSVGYGLSNEEVLETARKHGFTLGAHCDTGNKSKAFENGTGCGANDKVDIIASLADQYKEGIGTYLQSLMGEDFHTDVYEKTQIMPPSDNKNALMGLVGGELVETLVDDGEGVHGHREQMVVFNYQENTTIDRDAYFEATGKQVFTVDVWYIRKLAEHMAAGVDAERQASELYHAMMAYQVATYIGLCDGSHRVAVLPVEEKKASI